MGPAFAGTTESYPLRHFLLLAGEIFRRHRAFVSVAYLQTLPVGPDIWAEIPCPPDILGEPQGIANGNVGGGEAIGAQHLRLAGRRFNRPQPPQEPLCVVGRDLRVAPLFGLEL